MKIKEIIKDVYKAGNDSAQMPEDWEIVDNEFNEWFDYNGERVVKILNKHFVSGNEVALKSFVHFCMNNGYNNINDFELAQALIDFNDR